MSWFFSLGGRRSVEEVVARSAAGACYSASIRLHCRWRLPGVGTLQLKAPLLGQHNVSHVFSHVCQHAGGHCSGSQ